MQSNDLVNTVRRDLIKRFFGITAAVAVGNVPLQVLAYQKDDFFVPDVTPIKISDHIYALYARGAWPTAENQGFFANIYLVDTSAGIVVLDTGTSVHIGRMAIRAIKQHFNKSVVAIFNSHYHGDHWLGNQAFKEAFPNAPIYAHPEAKTAIQNAIGDEWLHQMMNATSGAVKGTQVVAPTEGVEHNQLFEFGNVKLKVHSYGQAHSPVDIMIEIVNDKALYVGDIIMENRIGNPSETSFKGYISTLNEIDQNLKGYLLMPGHGKPGKTALLKSYQEIMNGIYENAVNGVEQGLSISETKDLALKDPRIKKHAQTTAGFKEFGKFVSVAYTQAELELF